MRDNGDRQLWFHTIRRYRDATRVVLSVPVQRTRLGAVPILPPNTELISAAVLSGAKLARVLVRRWPESVSAELAEAGVERLVELMYDGHRERIQLPRAVAEVAFGQ
jgi:hypothetical protein